MQFSLNFRSRLVVPFAARVAAEPKDEGWGVLKSGKKTPSEADASLETNIRSGVVPAEATAKRRSVMVSAARRWAQWTKEHRHAEQIRRESTWTRSVEIRPRLRSCQRHRGCHVVVCAYRCPFRLYNFLGGPCSPVTGSHRQSAEDLERG